MHFNIFEKESYRDILLDILAIYKSKNSKYSYSYFSQQIGASQSYLKQVLSGHRNLTIDKAKKVAEALEFSNHETSYFVTLVLHETAKTDDMKDYFYNVAVNLRKMQESLSYSDKNISGSVFSSCNALEVYTLLGAKGINKSIHGLHERLKFNFSLQSIENTIRYLVSHGALELKNGDFKTKNFILEDERDVDLIYINNLNRAIMYLSNENFREKAEYFDSFCLLIGDEDYNEVKKVLEEAKNKLVLLSKNFKAKNRIAYFNTNFFFASKKP